MNQGTILGSQIGRWTTIAVLIAVLAALLTASGVLAQSNTETFRYEENGTTPVGTFTARDPEGGKIYWSLNGTDAADFSISNRGVLSFKKSPNYEMPTDRDESTDASGVGVGNNSYKVTVKAGDGGEGTIVEKMVTVIVTNMDEPGMVSIVELQPQVGEALTVTPADEEIDPDTSAGVTWQWASSSTMDGSYTDIQGATQKMYTPVADDVGNYLMVTATYTDSLGGTKSAYDVSDYAVRAIPASNTAPAFPDQDPSTAAVDTDATRSIAEGTPSGQPVGAPVVAEDDDDDVLLYTLAQTTPTPTADAPAAFVINKATGQIMTKGGLNADTGGTTSYTVTVTAVDPSGASTAPLVTVTITVTAVNEAPMITVGADTVTAKNYDENTDITDAAEAIDTYAATDPDGDTLGASAWSVSGPDGSLFEFHDTTEGLLQFKASPNYEMPMDTGKDNVYELAVVVTDPDGESDMLDVTVKVMNLEEAGEVTLSTHQPQVGVRITAELTDDDGGARGHKWQWYNADPDDNDDGILDSDAGDGAISGATSKIYIPKSGDATPTAVSLYVSVTYTDAATKVDSDGDPETGEMETATAEFGSGITVRVAPTSNAAPKFYKDGIDLTVDTNLIASNQTRTYTRYVQENSDVSSPVSLSMADADADTVVTTDADVTATDANADDASVLYYELDGRDKAYFKIVAAPGGTQTAVIQTAKKLDHEAKSTHTVTVKATDPSGLSATVTVTINVTDDEEVTKVTGPKMVDYPENGTGAVADFGATDEDADDRAFSFDFSTNAGADLADDGSDAGDSQYFNLNPRTGVLTFKKSPNYEMPRDAALSSTNTNTYTLTVRAKVVGKDPAEMAFQTVNVKVTNVPEAPKFDASTRTLTIAENTATDMEKKRDVGDPVTATDDDNDARTYTLSGTDAASFTIHPATGQIRTNNILLDYETKNMYSVVVTATDRSGLMDTINVTIEVTDEDEDPTLAVGSITVSGPSTVDDYPENGTDAVGTYEATGADGASATTATWSLEGADSDDFMLEGSDGSRMLKFDPSPNFESPADADGDNTYMVTVKATDPDSSTVMDTQEVTVTVVNVAEDGMVTLSMQGLMVGIAITATLSDEDGMVTDQVWQWQKSEDKASWMPAMGTATGMGAMTSSYTPESTDGGYYLRAMVTYDDASDEINPNAMSEPTGSMVAVVNNAPMFAEDTATRMIDENSAAETAVGSPVAATDADADDTLTYTLSGMDEMYFTIDPSTGQIMVGADTMLDYETKTSYSVMVTATDDSGASNNMSSINVTINVTDVDEMGTLSLSMMKPVVGTQLTANLMDPDGYDDVDWQWSRSMTLEGRFTHVDEETRSYTPVDDDSGYYLQVSATYDDGHGSKTLTATTTVVVRTALVAKFDTNENGMIDRNEAIAALRRYLDGDEDVSRNEAIAVLRLYLSN